MGKNKGVEIFRGLLMVWIVLYHYTCQYIHVSGNHEIHYFFTFPNGGVYGVFCFFVLSGFYAAQKICNELGGVNKSIAFFVNRYWRLWPAYALSCLIITIWLFLMPLPNNHTEPTTFLINFFLIVHPGVDFIDGAHWFIKTLVEINVFFSFALLFKNKRCRELFFLISLLLVFLMIYFNDVFPLFLQGEVLQFGTSYIATLLGFYFYKCKRSNYSKAILLLLLVIMSFNSFVYVLLFIAMALLIIYGNYISTKSNCVDFAVTFGEYSFFWYLIHQKIGLSIQYYVLPHGDISFAWVLVPMIVTFILAVCIGKFISMVPKKIIA